MFDANIDCGTEANIVKLLASEASWFAAFERFDFDELIDRLRTSAIAYGSVNDIGQLSAHAQLRRVTVNKPTGPAHIPASPVAGFRKADRHGDVPSLDSHGAAIREEFA